MPHRMSGPLLHGIREANRFAVIHRPERWWCRYGWRDLVSVLDCVKWSLAGVTLQVVSAASRTKWFVEVVVEGTVNDWLTVGGGGSERGKYQHHSSGGGGSGIQWVGVMRPPPTSIHIGGSGIQNAMEWFPSSITSTFASFFGAVSIGCQFITDPPGLRRQCPSTVRYPRRTRSNACCGACLYGRY